MDPAIIGGALKLVGGLLGGKKKSPTPRQNLLSQAQGAREAAEKYGFNPLTMLQYGQTAGAMGGDGSPPPLASLSILGDFITETYGDEAKERREHNKLQTELLRLELDRSRGELQAARSAVNSIGARPSPIGGGAPVHLGNRNGFGVPSVENSALSPGRERDIRPQENQSGIVEFDNSLTGPLKFFGADGEIIMEYLQVPAFGIPQIANNWAERLAGDYIAPWFGADPEKIEKKRAPYGRDAYGRPLPKSK